MLPYADDTRSYSFPFWTVLIIAVNTVVFLAVYNSDFVLAVFKYGAIPARFFGRDVGIDALEYFRDGGYKSAFEGYDALPPATTLFTSMFMHGGIMHLIGNMWFLWLFGDNVEDRMGKLLFPIFYITCGLVAALTHIVIYNKSATPVVGASGAIAGVMGAYILLFPRATIASLWTMFYFWQVVHVPAVLYLGIWFILQLFGGFADSGSNVAFMAHIGGFLFGLALAWIMLRLGLLTLYPDDRGYEELFRSNWKKRPPSPPSGHRKVRYTWK